MPDSYDCNRAHERVGIRTHITVITGGGSQRVVKAWSDDLSPSGARLLTTEPINASEYYLRVILPGLKDKFFVGQTVRTSTSVQPLLNADDQVLFTYGVRFIGICPEEEAEALWELVEPV